MMKLFTIILIIISAYGLSSCCTCKCVPQQATAMVTPKTWPEGEGPWKIPDAWRMDARQKKFFDSTGWALLDSSKFDKDKDLNIIHIPGMGDYKAADTAKKGRNYPDRWVQNTSRHSSSQLPWLDLPDDIGNVGTSNLDSTFNIINALFRFDRHGRIILDSLEMKPPQGAVFIPYKAIVIP